MEVSLKQLTDDWFNVTVTMITELMNYHRQLTNAPKKYWCTDEESHKTLSEWKETGTVYNMVTHEVIIGFLYVRFGGQNVAWLEDIYVKEEYRGKGLGKLALKKLDDLMLEKQVVAMFVNVIPRNTSAIKLYRECGFDHLNMIELRKNYDKSLDKTDEINVLGFQFKKF